jgi:hypothetical protein
VFKVSWRIILTAMLSGQGPFRVRQMIERQAYKLEERPEAVSSGEFMLSFHDSMKVHFK